MKRVFFLAGITCWLSGGCAMTPVQPRASAQVEQFRFPNGPTVAFEDRLGLLARKPAGAGLYYTDYGNEVVNMRLALMHMPSDLGCGNAQGCEQIAVDTAWGQCPLLYESCRAWSRTQIFRLPRMPGLGTSIRRWPWIRPIAEAASCRSISFVPLVRRVWTRSRP